MKKTLLFPLFLFFCALGISQTANDCANAIVVCGNSVISSNASGFGQQELDNPNNPCQLREVNSLWLQLNIDQTGLLEFTLTPDDSNLEVDYDFYIFGPSFSCGSDSAPIRCSTTNPNQASLTDNLTGLRSGETDEAEGPGPNGNSFIAPLQVTRGETYYLLIDRPVGNGGFSLDWQGSSDFVDPPPIIGEPDAITTCFADAGAPLDITQNENQIATDPSIRFEYYESKENAFDGILQIPDPTAYTVALSTTVYVKATNGNDCFEILEQQIDIDPPFSENLEFTACDQNNDGNEEFQLQPILDEISDGLQNPNKYDISIHTSENDADTNQNGLTLSFSSPNGLVYARIALKTNSTCFLTVPITLNVIATPVTLPTTLVQCDVDMANSTDGLTTFDLEQIFNDVEQSSTYDYSFYESEQLRDSDTELSSTDSYVNITPFTQTLYYSVRTATCESFGEIELQVLSTTVDLNDRSPLVSCTTDSSENVPVGSFDLDTFRQSVFPDTEAAFYPTLQDASSEQNAISGIYQSESNSIFIRIEDNNQCRTIEELQLTVNPLPEINLENEFRICEENPTLNIDAPEGFESYSWSKIDGSIANEITTTRNITLNETGTYRLTVGKFYENNGETIICTNETDFTVLPSNPAQITDVILSGSSASTTLEVRVSGDGDYEYSLDGTTYSDSNLFENIPSGTVTVFVRDKNGCGEVQETVSVFGFPKFFTPNGDAVNDFWQIIGADPESSTLATISIYDRYGKLLGQVDPFGQGWDGTYESRPLPESDYWFKVDINESREVKGHFSLKR